MSQVTFDPAVGGDGSTVSDDANPSTGLRRGGYKTRFVPALQNTVAVAGFAASRAAMASASQVAAAASAANAATSEAGALASRNAAQLSQTAAAASEVSALASKSQALGSQNAAALSESNAALSANAAEQFAESASISADQASISANLADGYKDDALVARNQAEEFALTAVNAPGTSATSVTSNSVDGGPSKTFFIQPGKSLVVGMFVLISAVAQPSNYLIGQITFYDATSGELTVDVERFNGSGTFNSWVISLTLAPILAGSAQVENLWHNRVFVTTSTSFTVPDGIRKVRAYAIGRGADGTVSPNGNTHTGGGGGGGGMAFGDIDVSPGEVLDLNIVNGVATVVKAGVALLTGNPGLSVQVGGSALNTGGTASIHPSVLNGFAYRGGNGGESRLRAGNINRLSGGGGSAGSPLGPGIHASFSIYNGGGGAGIGGPSAYLAGGGVSVDGQTRDIPGGSAATPPITVIENFQGTGLVVYPRRRNFQQRFTDPLLRGVNGMAVPRVPNVLLSAEHGVGGIGAETSDTNNGAGTRAQDAGDFAGGGGIRISNAAASQFVFFGGAGGLLGGGGSVSQTLGNADQDEFRGGNGGIGGGGGGVSINSPNTLGVAGLGGSAAIVLFY